MPTIRDVAKLAGVSISTVSLSLNSPDRVSPETRRKIDAAARSVGFVANPIAQTLKRGRSRLIGMVCGDITNPFFGKLLRAIERRAAEAGYLVIVSDTAGEPENERMIVRHLEKQRVAGLILSTCLPQGSPTDHLREIKSPLLLFDHRIEGMGCDYVGTDNALASAMLTEHLIRLGHRRIAFIAGCPGLYTATHRLKGYEDTLRINGLPVDPRLIVNGNYDWDGGYHAAMRLLTMAEERPTAIVAASNVMAVGALQASNELNLKCPEDVSLAGIDDLPWSAVIKPRITVAIQPVHEMAMAACDQLLKRIDSSVESYEKFEQIFAPSLSIGESTRPPS